MNKGFLVFVLLSLKMAAYQQCILCACKKDNRVELLPPQCTCGRHPMRHRILLPEEVDEICAQFCQAKSMVSEKAFVWQDYSP